MLSSIEAVEVRDGFRERVSPTFAACSIFANCAFPDDIAEMEHRIGNGKMSLSPAPAVCRLTSTEFTMSASMAGRDLIRGKLERSAGHLTPHFIRSGTLVDFAEFLVLTGCREMFGKNTAASVLQSNISLLNTTPANLLNGRCHVSRTGSGLLLGEAEVWDEELGRIAVIAQTVLLGGEANVQADNALEKERSRPALSLEESDETVAAVTDIPATRRQQIFEAARRIITEKGFERATMREIAKEADLRIPTLYQYFRSKDEILALIFDTYLEKMDSDLKAAIESETRARDRLIAAISATLASIDVYHREIRIMTQDTKSLRPAVRAAVINKMLRYLATFRNIVQEGVDTGEFRPVDAELYGNLIPMMCQVWAQRYWSVGKFGLRAVEEAVLDLTLRGLDGGRNGAGAARRSAVHPPTH